MAIIRDPFSKSPRARGKAKSTEEEYLEYEMSQPAYDARPGFTFGCDPEVFILDEKGVPVTAEGLIPGTKLEPHPVKHGAVQVDGMAAEFNIDPAENFSDFNRNVTTVMDELKKMLPKGHSLSIVPSVVFDPAVFEAAPDKAKELGCNPDFDAWTGSVNPPPNDPENPYMRCGAGHVHIGWGEDFEDTDEQHIMNCRDLVRQCDWFLGGWSVRIDSDPTRRRLYGKAGAYRPKSYGVEYRVLSNFWITTRERRLAMWNRLQIAIMNMQREYLPERVPPPHNDLLVSYINETKKGDRIEKDYRYPLVVTEPHLARYI